VRDPGRPLNLGGESTEIALPEGWLLGALLVLIDRVGAFVVPTASWTDNELKRNRGAFMRPWCLAITQAAIEGLLFLLGNATA
jgi:hypothetical protein